MIKKEYWPNGNIYRIEYINKKDVFYHRLNGAAYQTFYKNGFRHAIEYWVNGNFHSITHPAQIIFNLNHKIESSFYMINDKKFNNQIYWKNKIKAI